MISEYDIDSYIDYESLVLYSSDLQLDNIKYQDNEIKNAIKNNKPLEDKLNVIICISNPIQYKRRFTLAQEFIKRFDNEESNVNLYVVELAYNIPGKPWQNFNVIDANNPRHLRLRTNKPPIWTKENMWNIGVAKLLPKDWKCVAFCDADIEFDNPHWALDTLRLLNGTKDITQLHSHCIDLDQKEDPMNCFSSFCFQYVHKRKYMKGGLRFWHPGFNVAMTRETYEKIGGIYDYGILGSGDTHLFLSIIGEGVNSIHPDISDGYKKSLEILTEKCIGLKMGYIPGIIKHYFHGSKKNRKYTERWKILVTHQFDPYTHLKKDKIGLYIPTKEMPKGLLDDILNYFTERNEDEYFQ